MLILLQIHDGPNIKSPLIGRYCGSDKYVQPINSNSNEVTLLFISDDFSSVVKGFTIKYEICMYTFFFIKLFLKTLILKQRVFIV